MNSTAEESTFFITIEKSNIKYKNQSLKNTKPKYFCQSIKTIKHYKNKSSISSSYFKNNENINLNPSLSTQIKTINNNSKINDIQQCNPNVNKSQSFNSSKKYQNRNINDNFEDNIEIEEDIDEFCDTNMNINIKKPRLPFSVNNYSDNNISSSISRNILNNYLDRYSKDNSQEIKTNKLCKNASCSFENNELLKLKLNQNISSIDSKINILKNILKKKNLEILSLKIFFEKHNSNHRIRKNNRNYEKNIDEMRKEILNLKLKKSNYEEKYVNKKLLEKEINKENIIFLAKKAEIIEKIMDYKINIYNNNINYNTNNNINYIETSTIINDSFIFDNENNIIETKENINFSEIKDEKIKSNEVINYFIPRFLVETKLNNKNKNQQKYNLNSKFNILINCKNVK